MCVGDPSLGPVEDPLVAVLLGCGRGRAGVAAIAGFGEAETADLVTVDEGSDVLLL